MITIISGFVDFTRRGEARPSILVFGLGVILTLSSCRDRAPEYNSPNRLDNALLGTLQGNFELATQGNEAVQGAPKANTRMTKMPSANSAGIGCSPAKLTRSASGLRIDLPERASKRPVVLAAITPDGALRLIYESYPADVESIEVIVPSRTIDWVGVSERQRFDVDAQTFDALVPDETTPRRLFQKPGIYQFALFSSYNPDYLKLHKTAFQVLAGCVVHWQP